MTPDFFALPRPTRQCKTICECVNDREISITLRAMDLLDMHRMVTLRDRMADKYVPFEFRRTPPEADAPEPVDFPPVGGEAILLSEETCEACATLVVMQPEVQFGFEQLVAFVATCPELFQTIITRAIALNHGEMGKAEWASTENMSASPLPTA